MCLRVLKESTTNQFDSFNRQEQCIDHILCCLSGLSRAHFYDNLSQNSCIPRYYIHHYSPPPPPLRGDSFILCLGMGILSAELTKNTSESLQKAAFNTNLEQMEMNESQQFIPASYISFNIHLCWLILTDNNIIIVSQCQSSYPVCCLFYRFSSTTPILQHCKVVER